MLQFWNINPLSGNAPYFIILLCLTADNFTRQGESAATQWLNYQNRVKAWDTCCNNVTREYI
jgi:hypothetical protein